MKSFNDFVYFKEEGQNPMSPEGQNPMSPEGQNSMSPEQPQSKMPSQRTAIELAKRNISHTTDGPLTAYVLISRATELAKKVHSETVANALYEELARLGFLNEKE